ncbi:Serpentine type 7TM GPCR chemoreceptor Srsx [Parelaphostrongylus tenuis]|uniref:Serpentine type 7TM GPCR chemoreceptor Srsx n=1 Tax=Parelaphostrongylus tenuis TaxID=148309 RepID=A0AAD5QQJ5_PARTN|nr:Serpentine type 7TM GPCR chemoreceptor Srsx [Parelaphostrongylus tenuis]
MMLVSYMVNGLNIATLILLLLTFLVVRKSQQTSSTVRLSPSDSFQRTHRLELKLMRSFATLVGVFVCCWCIATLITHISYKYLHRETYLTVQTYGVLLVLPNYCQCYFVTCVRSSQHRSAYRKQLLWLFPCLGISNREESTPARRTPTESKEVWVPVQ